MHKEYEMNKEYEILKKVNGNVDNITEGLNELYDLMGDRTIHDEIGGYTVRIKDGNLSLSSIKVDNGEELNVIISANKK